MSAERGVLSALTDPGRGPTQPRDPQDEKDILRSVFCKARISVAFYFCVRACVCAIVDYSVLHVITPPESVPFGALVLRRRAARTGRWSCVITIDETETETETETGEGGGLRPSAQSYAAD